MPVTPNFAASQTIGAPSIIKLTDTSTGSDVTIAQRRVYIRKLDQSTLVPSGTTTSYVEWGDFPATTTIEIDVLQRDMCLSIQVGWCTSGGTIVVTKTIVCLFTLYSEDFYYSITQDQSSDPDIIRDRNYYDNKMKLRVELDSAAQAVSYASDQASAQGCLDRAYTLIQNEFANF